MGFVNDLKSGRKYEKIVEQYFQDYITIEYPTKEERKFYDFAVVFKNDEEILIEVKADFASVKTGNFAIEYECSGTPSGITSTWADFYIIFSCSRDTSDEYTAYKIPTEKLKEICNNGKWKKLNGGDGYRSKFWLIPVSEFEKYKLLYGK
jgi:hypothetical protein